MSLLSLKKVPLPTKFNSGLPAGLVSELFFCGKITTNQKPFPHCWSSTPSSLLTGAGPSGAFGGENLQFLSVFSTKNSTVVLLEMGTGQQPNQDSFYSVEVSALLWGRMWKLQPVPSKTSQTEPWYQTNLGTLVPPQLSLTSAQVKPRFEFALWGCFQQKFGDGHQDQRD